MTGRDGYRDLKVWQRGFDLALAVYRATATFPADERFGLVSQMRRSPASIPANIAEGNGRESTKDFLRFLAIASGSLNELETFVLLAEQLHYLPPNEAVKLLDETNEISRMIRGLQRTLRNKLEP